MLRKRIQNVMRQKFEPLNFFWGGGKKYVFVVDHLSSHQKMNVRWQFDFAFHTKYPVTFLLTQNNFTVKVTVPQTTNCVV